MPFSSGSSDPRIKPASPVSPALQVDSLLLSHWGSKHICYIYIYTWGFPGGSDSKGICLQCRRPGFNLWVGKIPWRREWLPTPKFLPVESYGQRSLVDYSPWGCKDLDMTEQRTHTHILIYIYIYIL